jgi:hypothetical protein
MIFGNSTGPLLCLKILSLLQYSKITMRVLYCSEAVLALACFVIQGNGQGCTIMLFGLAIEYGEPGA